MVTFRRHDITRFHGDASSLFEDVTWLLSISSCTPTSFSQRSMWAAKSRRKSSRHWLKVRTPMCSPSATFGDGSSVHHWGSRGEGCWAASGRPRGRQLAGPDFQRQHIAADHVAIGLCILGREPPSHHSVRVDRSDQFPILDQHACFQPCRPEIAHRQSQFEDPKLLDAVLRARQPGKHHTRPLPGPDEPPAPAALGRVFRHPMQQVADGVVCPHSHLAFEQRRDTIAQGTVACDVCGDE